MQGYGEKPGFDKLPERRVLKMKKGDLEQFLGRSWGGPQEGPRTSSALGALGGKAGEQEAHLGIGASILMTRNDAKK